MYYALFVREGVLRTVFGTSRKQVFFDLLAFGYPMYQIFDEEMVKEVGAGNVFVEVRAPDEYIDDKWVKTPLVLRPRARSTS
jgi:hypothetical protein